jgi:hypothetical protein
LVCHTGGGDKKKESEGLNHSPSSIISYQGATFDSKDFRWGGAGIDDSTASYEDSVGETWSILDIYNLTPQERHKLFISEPLMAFAIFEDLIEHRVVLDQEAIPWDDVNTN